ncbi:zinc-binding dehydrogenase [Streptomyces poonensis]|uniref:Alcohol dehydrogenase-like C-terminal domain-containing protein n=1 Tax=Streptomyces poonensis TaxID=68255 RepID=A0A918UW99_9ACTN|nr:hypothetical protein GCM10010365_71160 [Streptomyces poonensis]GLJ92868.1 hypothetical protein GCM10017589_54790 [Streptomyces poonensis]
MTLAVEAVVATAGEHDADHCMSLGAAEVVDYADPRVAERLKELCPWGVDMYVDTSGETDLTTAVGLLAHRGRIVLLAGAHTAGPAGRTALHEKLFHQQLCHLARHDGGTRRGGRHDQPPARLRPTPFPGDGGPAAERGRRSARANGEGQLHGKRVILAPHWPVRHR